MKNVVIVIVTYNSAKHIDQCLKSIELYPFTNANYSIIICDNNSQDNTRQIVGRYKKLKLISNENNIGFALAVNRVIQKTFAEYILLLNPDTKVKPNSLNNLLETQIIERADICGGKMIGNDKYVHRTCVRHPDLMIGLFDFTNVMKLFPNNKWHREFYYLNDNLHSKTSITVVDAVSGGYMLITRNIYNMVGGFDDKYFMYLEDVDFCLKAKYYDAKILYCPNSIIWHEGGGSSSNSKKINYEAWINSRKYYFYKNCSFATNIIIQPIFIVDKFITDIWRYIKKP